MMELVSFSLFLFMLIRYLSYEPVFQVVTAMKTASDTHQLDEAPNSSPVRSFLQRPRNAIGLLVVAAIAWGAIFLWQSRHAPVLQHIDAGREFMQQGQRANAEQEWLQAVRLDPDNTIAWELLGDYYTEANLWPKARHAYQQVVRLQPDTPQIYTQLAISEIKTGDMLSAQNSLRQALQHDPNDADALYTLANMLAASRLDDKLQLDYWRRLVKVRPDNIEYLTRTAELAIRQRQFKEALPLVERLLQLDSQNTPAHAMHGEVLFHLAPSDQAPKDAESSLLKALELNPGDEQSLIYLAKIYLKQGKSQQAIERLELLDRRRPINKAYLQDLARAYQQTEDTKLAAEARQRYAAFQKQISEIGVFRAHVDRDAADFNSTLQLGIKLMRSDNPVGAEKYLQKALKLRPDSKEAKLVLQELERRYVEHLQKGRDALNKGDMQIAEWHLTQASLLRSTDGRAQAAVRQYADQSGGAMPRALEDFARLGTP